jgi:two-component system CheB/CheR fusion protein
LQACQENGQVVVRVRDNGVGIPEKMLSRIFEMFTQIDLLPDRSQGGLGIGLSVVRQLVDLHGGRIAVHSAGLNQGSEFSVHLPLVEDGQISGNQAATAGPAPSSRHRILLIEDNPDARESLGLLLTLMGHEVDLAENGRQGIEAARSHAPHIALIDIGLPDMNGYEVAAQLKALPGSPPILVALTGFTQPDDRSQALEAGFQTHLTKPVDLRTLQAILAIHIANK